MTFTLPYMLSITKAKCDCGSECKCAGSCKDRCCECVCKDGACSCVDQCKCPRCCCQDSQQCTCGELWRCQLPCNAALHVAYLITPISPLLTSAKCDCGSECKCAGSCKDRCCVCVCKDGVCSCIDQCKCPRCCCKDSQQCTCGELWRHTVSSAALYVVNLIMHLISL